MKKEQMDIDGSVEDRPQTASEWVDRIEAFHNDDNQMMGAAFDLLNELKSWLRTENEPL